MRLTELQPVFLDGGGADADGKRGRTGVGLQLLCPCGNHEEDHSLFVPFANPLDGGPQYGGQGWQRTGETFETLTLTPSILRQSFGTHISCGWHGWITNGDVITV